MATDDYRSFCPRVEEARRKRERHMRINKLIRIAALVVLTIIGISSIGYLYRTGPQADETVWSTKPTRRPQTPLAVVFNSRHFDPITIEYSLSLWNGIMPKGQPLFFSREGGYSSSGNMVKVISADGVVCDRLPVDPGMESDRGDDHSARSYQCSDGSWQVHVSSPGNIHTQYCIIAHELGHVLGLADDKSGSRVMNQTHCPELVRISDKDSQAVVERYKINE